MTEGQTLMVCWKAERIDALEAEVGEARNVTEMLLGKVMDGDWLAAHRSAVEEARAYVESSIPAQDLAALREDKARLDKLEALGTSAAQIKIQIWDETRRCTVREAIDATPWPKARAKEGE